MRKLARKHGTAGPTPGSGKTPTTLLVRREINDGAYNDLLDFLVHVRPIYGSLSNGCRELVSAHPLFKRWNQQR